MSSTTTAALFKPVRVGDLELGHRVVLAPLTRFRATDDHIPLPHVLDYYTQRGSVPGTLLVTEATYIAPQAGGYPNVPGIWNDEQIAAWKKITDSVHARGSYIYLQLWALGRAAIPNQLKKEGDLPFVSASAVPLRDRPKTDPLPRPLTIEEIQQYIGFYAQAAENAVLKAGFDGVEIHGANGYLIDQFLQDVSNTRTDAYGGGVEGRTRFALEVVDAVVKRVGPRKVGLRLSPWGTVQDMGMADPKPTYSHLITQLVHSHPTLAYVHLVEPRSDAPRTGPPAVADEFLTGGPKNDFIRNIWNSPDSAAGAGRRLISAGGYTRESGIDVAERKGDLIAYGRPFISNPDIPYRLQHGLPLTVGDRKMYYQYGSYDPTGYSDYPFSEEFVKEYGIEVQRADEKTGAEDSSVQTRL
ncbi:hypothetical protein BDQ12DRAFT_687024 [Crucibulum laeve]|uniref:NADH:flavin oxidoreductase/NADH oxidase N-terminal domain-containing protein n=1 Tax=Crucibulum laeve TaxID=68775 RepID=A0A5C3LSM9_9AGAR|nr:hypothetical protein BDQ12DRAFT_687024 [Crucibulum laeve]